MDLIGEWIDIGAPQIYVRLRNFGHFSPPPRICVASVLAKRIYSVYGTNRLAECDFLLVFFSDRPLAQVKPLSSCKPNYSQQIVYDPQKEQLKRS